MHLPDPRFPPLLTAEGIKAPLAAFDEACRRAAEGQIGAGDCLWARRTDRAALAIVLEPEVPLAEAIQMGPLLQTAVVVSLGALLPPQVAVTIRWPGTLLLNGGIAGDMRIAAPAGPADAVPSWLVVGCDVVLSRDLAGREPGEDVGSTSAAEEGAGDLDRTRILESIAAHFLTWLDIWSDDGFRAVHQHWLGRVEGYGEAYAIRHGTEVITGRVLGLDDAMTLMVRSEDGETRALAFMEHVARRALTAGGER